MREPILVGKNDKVKTKVDKAINGNVTTMMDKNNRKEAINIFDNKDRKTTPSTISKGQTEKILIDYEKR
jgi:ribosomal protein L21